MEKQILPAPSKALLVLEGKVQSWRQTRQGRSRMPVTLWNEAVELANQLGRMTVVRSLGLSRSQLQRRIAGRVAAPAKVASRPPCFVELAGTQVLMAPQVTEAAGLVVEVIERDGARMTLRFPGGTVPDAQGLLHAFCGVRRC